MRSMAHEFATQRNATPPRHESWDTPGPGTDRDTRRSRGSRRPRLRLSRRAPPGPRVGRSSAGRSGWACSGRRPASATSRDT